MLYKSAVEKNDCVAVLMYREPGAAGIAIASTALALWVTLPVALGLRAFRKRDF